MILIEQLDRSAIIIIREFPLLAVSKKKKIPTKLDNLPSFCLIIHIIFKMQTIRNFIVTVFLSLSLSIKFQGAKKSGRKSS